MSELLAELEVSIQAREQAAVKTKEYFAEHKANIIDLLSILTEVNIVRCVMDVGSVDISVSGDKAMVKLVWNKLRNRGYVTELNPAENEVHFSGWWYKEDHPRIWLSFSSTVCTRVKVGTKMVEQDIYEVVCE